MRNIGPLPHPYRYAHAERDTRAIGFALVLADIAITVRFLLPHTLMYRSTHPDHPITRLACLLPPFHDFGQGRGLSATF